MAYAQMGYFCKKLGEYMCDAGLSLSDSSLALTIFLYQILQLREQVIAQRMQLRQSG